MLSHVTGHDYLGARHIGLHRRRTRPPGRRHSDRGEPRFGVPGHIRYPGNAGSATQTEKLEAPQAKEIRGCVMIPTSQVPARQSWSPEPPQMVPSSTAAENLWLGVIEAIGLSLLGFSWVFVNSPVHQVGAADCPTVQGTRRLGHLLTLPQVVPGLGVSRSLDHPRRTFH